MNNDYSIFEPDELLALANIDMEKGRFDQALAKLKYTLNMDDTPDAVYAAIARLYGQIGLYEKAKIMFQKFIDKNPDAVLETFQLGMTCLDAGDEQGALDVWTKLIAAYPDHPPALYYKAFILARREELDAARQNLEMLLNVVTASNLYFGKGKELLDEINSKKTVDAGVVKQDARLLN